MPYVAVLERLLTKQLVLFLFASSEDPTNRSKASGKFALNFILYKSVSF